MADLDAIFEYLDARSPAAALAVKGLVEKRIAQLASYPFIAPETDEPGVFEFSLVRYPYKIYYTVDADEVRILHIRHTSRREWQAPADP